MMSDTSPRLNLPFLQPAQAQKHVTHNEALRLLDVATQLSVTAFEATTPPGTAPEGALYALGAAPQGLWAGHAGALALMQAGQWQFFTPLEGWRAALLGSAQLFILRGGAWVPVVPATDNLAQVGINTNADASNRLSVRAPQTLLSHEGAGHRLTLNKASAADSVEIVWQSDWSGRAALTLDGGDVLKLKLSPDGSNWQDALCFDGASGHMGVGIATPARPLHITEAMRLEPGGEPANPVAGDLYFDSALAVLRCHDGTAWRDLF